ncbi:reverse transcriptase domain-containing protein [Tanacetum coccineum]
MSDNSRIQGVIISHQPRRQWKLLPEFLLERNGPSSRRGIIVEEHLHVKEKKCQKVKTVQEDIRSQNLRSKGQVWRMRIYPNRGQVERRLCHGNHMFNSTLIGSARVWFDDLPPESIDSYDYLKEAFLASYLQQKKCIKDPVEIHNIKQREGESTEDFV